MEATQKVAPKKPEAGAKKEGDNKPKDTKPRENKAGENKTGDNKNGENKPRENKPREGGDNKPRENKPREGGDNKPRENKPREGGDKTGENKPRGPRPEGAEGAEGDKKPRGPRPEGAEGEKKKEFVKRDPADYHYRKPYIKRQEKGEREEVTLETKIPELPKNNKKLGQPDDSAFEKQIVGIYVTIEDLYTKMNDIAKEEYNKINSTSRETGDQSKSLRDIMTSKTDERKTVRAELDILQSQLDQFKVSMEEYYDKTHKYRQHMKKFFNKEDILKELNSLRHRQSQEQLSLQEEKKVVKEIAELEKALPYAEPLEKLENDFADQKEKKKVVKKQADELRGRIKLLNGEITDIFTQLDTFRDALKQNKEEAAPTVKKIRDEYKEKIQERKERIQTLKKEHDEQWQKYEEQQELIRRIQWMQRVQERLRRDQERQQRFDEEEKLRLAEEEEAKLLTVPFREEIELCELLVSYLERLQPKAAEEVVPEKTAEEKKADIESALKGEEWSKVKVQLISSKKDADNDFFSAKPKKDKKSKSAKPAEAQENRSQVIQHSIDILNYFDNVKISPPLVSTALPDAIKTLQDKKEYFQKLSDAEMLKPVEERTAPKDQKAQTDETKEGEQDKKPSKKNAKKTYEADDSEFPEIK